VRHPLCAHVEYETSPTGRVSVSVSQNGRVAERRSFPSMRSASRFFRKALYCGRKGAAFLPLGAQYRAVELQRARATLNGLRRVR